MEVGVSSIPVSEVRPLPFLPSLLGSGQALNADLRIAHTLQFYCAEHVVIGENYARFAFCKDLDTLRRAAERLQRLREFVV